MFLSRSVWLLALRGLQRHRRANAAIVATLAVLAAVLVAMLSLGHNLLVAPWTYDSARFGVLRHGIAGSTQERYGFAPDAYRALRDAGVFESLAASTTHPVAFGDGLGAARPLTLVRTTPSALDVTDAQPLLGRFVAADEDGDTRRVVISHALWKGDFDGRADVLGQDLLFDGQRHEIVGVMPPRFHFMGGDVWTAHLDDPARDTTTDTRLVLNFKLRAGVSIADTAAALVAVADALPGRGDPARYPRGWHMTPLRVIDAVTGPQRPAIVVVLAGAAALLVLGVLNVAALLVARQIADAGTVATRRALGESRRLGVAVAFVESLLLALAALAIALPLGRVLFDRFVGLVALEWVPRELEGAFAYSTPALWSLPWIGIAIAALLTLLRLPALLHGDARGALSGQTRVGGRRGDMAASRWLAGLQLALASAFLVSTLAIGAGAQALAERDLGFERAATQHAVLVFPRERYADGAQRMAALDRLAETLRADGAAAVGFTTAAPLQRYTRIGHVSAMNGVTLDEAFPIDHQVAHGDLAGALGLRLREGRFLDPRIDRADGEAVAVVTRAVAERLAPQGSALGLRITAASGSDVQVARRVVGVVDDVRHESPLAPTRPTLYVPYAQDAAAATPAGGQVALLVRWQAMDAAATQRIQAALAAIDPWIALREVTTLEARAERSVAGVTLARQLFAGFAVLGLLLATLGVAAVAALGVARQHHGLAVRAAIGATPRRQVFAVFASSVRVAVPATLAGAGLAWLLVGAMQAALQDAAALQWQHLLAAPALLLACALLATLLPARAATRVQPLSLLRGG
ncbi:ABC transporter permease [Chiayiivirga flava]|uniref:Putative permease n=1 Tax=Chiayiivirga flava TaxID=659595 RepID=A0A7W8D520_9GAMM|nr:ABC transporter permease [Chiayiivirga flava]MBB5208054.1 putative permease [Chiayiivirga flava]